MQTNVATSVYTTITGCRSCGSSDLTEVLSLGTTPLADALLAHERLGEPEISVPLTLLCCLECSLVQIAQTVAPEVLFCRDYPYYSSVSPVLMRHFERSAESLIATGSLGRSSLVVEAASNDGYMLRAFAERNIPVLGIDPAAGPAARARESGIETLCTFFTHELAESLRAHGRRADLFLANNVLAHVADLNGFVEGIRVLLAAGGIAVIEVPYLIDLIDHCEFDTIYHQHLSYFSVTALTRLFERHGLCLNHVERTPIHGGSLRLFVEHRNAPDSSIEGLLADEAVRASSGLESYRAFARRIETLRDEVMDLLTALKSQGNKIAGYGAAAKATTLLSYFGIDHDILDFIVDLSPYKTGLFMAGNHIPIEAPTVLPERRPDYVLILAWNFADEIIRQQRAYREGGGRMIVPIPQLAVIEPARAEVA